jgi:hypothetical protein
LSTVCSNAELDTNECRLSIMDFNVWEKERFQKDIKLNKIT